MKQAARFLVVFVLIPFVFLSCPNPLIQGDGTFTVSYDANGATGGTAPVDPKEYRTGDIVEVRGAEGLFRLGYAFSGWNGQPDGKGVTYPEAQTFVMGAKSVTLFAKWTLVPTYGVSYVPNGATSGMPPVDANSYKTGESVTVQGPGSLVRDGWAFVGWNSKPDGTGSTWVEGQTLKMGDGQVILYARWSNNPVYALSYDDNGALSGSLPSGPSFYESGAIVTVLGNNNGLARPGSTFSGWNTMPDGTGVSFAADSTFTMGNHPITLYAVWTPNPTYLLSYDANGADSGSVPASTAHEAGESVVVMGNNGNLVRSGHWFAGWNTVSDGSGLSYDPGAVATMPTQSVTLYAQWSLIPLYTVVYLPNSADSGNVPVDSSLYNQGEAVVALGNSGGLDRSGYAFGGWNTAADGSGITYGVGQSFAMGGSNLNLYARWIPLYRIIYDSDEASGGTAPVDSALYAAGDQVIVMGNPGSLTRTGYGFAGWNTAQDGSGINYTQGQALTMGAAELRLYAHWTADPLYLLSYAGNGATGGAVPLIPTEHPAGASLTIPGPGSLVRSGYAFAGWNTASDGSGTAYTEGATFVMPNKDTVLYAQWSTASSYALVYDGNLSTGGTAPATPSYLAGALVTVMANTGNFVRSGYLFAGWNTAANGSGTAYIPGSFFIMPANIVTLYAQWTIIPTYSVGYDANGADNAGTGTLPAGVTGIAAGAPYSVQANIDFYKVGYSFSGWCTAPDGNGPVYDGGDSFSMPPSNLILYATWTIIPTYALSFVGNGADGGTAPATIYRAAGDAYSLPTNTFTRTNHSFDGWNTQADGSGDAYAQGASFIMPAAATIIYATWTPLTWPVSYAINGGTGSVPSGGAFAAGSLIPVDFGTIPTPPAGSTFVGWNSASDGSGIRYTSGSSFFMGPSPVTLWAQYSANPTFRLSYASNGATGGTAPIDPTFYEAGSTATIQGPGSLTREGYSFIAWNTASDGSGSDVSGTFIMPAADTILYARWTANLYTLSYDLNMGTGMQPAGESRTMGQTSNLSSFGLPTRTGYTCRGWCADSGGLGPVYGPGAPYTMPAANVVLYAVWAANPTYALSYDGNGATSGSLPAGTAFNEAGATVTVLGNSGSLVKPGYAFSGWNTKTDGTGTNYAPSDSFSMPAEGVILYARWIGTTYSVSYSVNGGGGMAPTDGTPYSAGQTVNLMGPGSMTPPAGTAFYGWALNAGGTGAIYQPSATISMGASDLNLYAVWKPVYTLTYDLSGGIGTTPTEPGAFFTGTALTVKDIEAGTTYPGHSFAGWVDTDGSTYSQNYAVSSTLTMPSRNVTLRAQWEPVNYALIFEANMGTPSGSYTFPVMYMATYSDSYSALSNDMCMLARSGMAFNGWNTADDGSGTHYAEGQTLTNFTSNLVLYAEWVPGYEVSYNANGATSGLLPTPSVQSYPQNGTYYVQPNSGGLFRDGFSFSCWNTAPDGTGLDRWPSIPYSPLISNLPLYAKWIPYDYFVTYDGNGATGGTIPNDAMNPYYYQESVTIMANVGGLYKTGYAFSGWNTMPNGTGLSYPEGIGTSMPMSDLNLFAVWTPLPYSISYDANGGSGFVPVDPATYHIGEQAVVRSQSGIWRDGYLFAGWNTQSDGSGFTYPTDSYYTFSDHSQTLFAMWSPVPTYTLTYSDVGGAVGSLPSPSFGHKAGDIVALDGDAPFYSSYTREGYDFMGWNTGNFPDYAGGTAYMVNNLYVSGLNPVILMPNNHLTLNAWWLPKHYGISFDSNGGYSSDFSSGNGADYDDLVTIPQNWNPLASPAPTPYVYREGYTFTGWDLSPSPTPSVPPFYPVVVLPTTVPMSTLVTLASPPPNESVRLYAQWSANTYNLTYDGNSYTAGDPPAGGIYATDQTVFTQPNMGGSPSWVPMTREGYSFDGWCMDDPTGMSGMHFGASGGESFSMPPHNTILYAMWKQNWYNVSYNPNGATSGYPPWDGASYAFGQTVTIMGQGSLSKPGYAFGGWTLEPDGDPDASEPIYGPSWTTDLSQPDWSLQFYARWVPIYYDLYLDYNGGTGPAISHPIQSGVDTSYTLSLPDASGIERMGYIFSGWCVNPSGYGQVYPPASSFPVGDNLPGSGTDIYIYAVWTLIPSYSLVYFENPGSSMNAGPYQAGTPVTVSASVFTPPAGKGFMAWNTAADGSGVSYAPGSSFIMPYQNTTLYAIWGTQVLYDLNGGSGTAVWDNELYRSGQAVYAKAKPFDVVRPGYAFDGWAPYPDGSGGPVYPGESFTVGSTNFDSAPIILYARWKSALTAKVSTLYNDWDSASFKAVTTDGYGNVYAVGSYYGGGTAYFGSQSWMGTNSGDTAIVVKYGKDGSVQWVGGAKTGVNPSTFNSVAVDASGNVYMVGSITGSGSYQFGSSATGAIVNVNAVGSYQNSFIIKYGPDGTPLVAKGMSTVSNKCEFLGVAVGNGYAYAVGYQFGSATFFYQGAGSSVSSPFAGGRNAILVQYPLDLSSATVEKLNSASNESWFNAVAVGPSYVYVAGAQFGNSTFMYDSLSKTGPASSKPNAVVVAYASGLVATYAKLAATASMGTEFFSVAVDGAGDVYAAGIQDDTTIVYWDAFMGSIFTSGSSSMANRVLVKWSSILSPLWARTTANGSGKASGWKSLAVDRGGKIIAAGFQEGSVGHDFGGIVGAGASSNRNVSVASYASNGTIVWARSLEASAPDGNSLTEFYGVAVDTDNNPVCVGIQQSGTLSNIFGYGLDVNTTSQGGTTGVITAVAVKYLP